jgi:hypothetical protein
MLAITSALVHCLQTAMKSFARLRKPEQAAVRKRPMLDAAHSMRFRESGLVGLLDDRRGE